MLFSVSAFARHRAALSVTMRIQCNFHFEDEAKVTGRKKMVNKGQEFNILCLLK